MDCFHSEENVIETNQAEEDVVRRRLLTYEDEPYNERLRKMYASSKQLKKKSCTFPEEDLKENGEHQDNG